ncbi:MAG: BtaA family protein [Salibacteraceae bacterium]|nr:BtaA family protein [Salibacteraceae bacterium]MDP4845572.1 BtaA family protein [Salibacteraceae bacterium]
MESGILYSMCWEDPEFLLHLVNENDKVLIVCSAGDNAISTLVKKPASCTAVDTNQDQIDLAKNKLSLYKNLPYEGAMRALGVFEKGDKNGLIHNGRFENYLRLFRKRFLPLVVSETVVQHFLKAETLEKQEVIYEKHINKWLYRLLFRVFFSKTVMKRKGRHPDLLKHVSEKQAGIFYSRIKHAWTDVPIAKNYFFRYIIQGYFQPSLNLPSWAKAVHFDDIKTNSDRLIFEHSSISAFLQASSDKKFDLIYLSDITETMDLEAANELFALCRAHLSPEGKLVLWNNLVDRKPSVGWQIDEEITDKLWTSRLINLYGFFGVFKRV